MKVAINGAGIAGPTLAYWLHRFGHEPLLIEKAPRLRTGGYIVDFWGVGFDIAEKMGLISTLEEYGYLIEDMRWVDAEGRKTGGFDSQVLRDISDGRFVSIERYDLAAAIYGTVEGKVETIFDDSIAGIEERADGVHVTFENAPPRDFDLVVGADGLHSRVRELVFGPMERFETDLGLRVAAIEAEGYRPRDELVFISHTEPGRQVGRFSKRDDRTLFLIGFRNCFAGKGLPRTDEERKAGLERAMAGVGWEWPRISEAMQDVDEIYYDKVSQIRIEHWSKGRTVLLGDAAAAVSLLAGEGTGLAMLEAYVLAGELSRAEDDYAAAFSRYEERLKPFIERKQKGALNVASSFVPNTRYGILFRDFVTRLSQGPLVIRLGLGDITDDMELPDYEGDDASGTSTPAGAKETKSSVRKYALVAALAAGVVWLILWRKRRG